MFTIYLIRNLVNGKIYVGQTNKSLGSRWYSHRYDAIVREEQWPMCRAIRKYGHESFTIESIATAETREWSDYLEQVWILVLDARNDKIGYNVRQGGNTSPMLASTKEALRRSRLGKSHTPEARELISIAGKKSWEEGRHHGHPHTEEAKKNMRAAKSKKNNNRWLKKLNDVELVFLFNNGVTIEKMSEYFDVNPKTISKHIRFTDLPLLKPHRDKGKNSAKHRNMDEGLLARLCNAGVSINEMSKQLNCEWMTVKKRIDFLGLTRKETP